MISAIPCQTIIFNDIFNGLVHQITEADNQYLINHINDYLKAKVENNELAMRPLVQHQEVSFISLVKKLI